MLFEDVFSSLPADQYQLRCVSNGKEVISYLRSVNNPTHFPDLIILDEIMPLMSGRETLEFLKGHDVYKYIPVVLYSTENDNDFKSDCEAKGVVAVLPKPDSYEGYIQMINNFLRYSTKPIV
jgi:CheY-like chemotaxis protein